VLSAENHRAVRRAAERVASTRRPVTFDIDEPSFGGTVSVSLSLLRLAEGTYYIHTLRDITEQRQMQERLAQASKMASIGHLAAGVAHEINTPLATITGCAQSLSRQLAATPELHQGGRWDAIAERLSTIVDQSFRCKKITRDLLDFAKPTKPVLRLTDLEVLLRETVEGIPYDAKATRVRFSTIGTAVPVMTDSDLLRQVVLNLVVNALDAVEGRMGAVINIEVRYLKRRVRIGVRDSGGGIAADDIDRIFDPFFTTKAPGKGTGLGLSISQSITQSLGGRLDASSVKGKGATFVVELPLDAVEARVRGARNRRTP
jgi:two-component system NtrC family sensor kinase